MRMKYFFVAEIAKVRPCWGFQFPAKPPVTVGILLCNLHQVPEMTAQGKKLKLAPLLVLYY